MFHCVCHHGRSLCASWRSHTSERGRGRDGRKGEEDGERGKGERRERERREEKGERRERKGGGEGGRRRGRGGGERAKVTRTRKKVVITLKAQTAAMFFY